MQSKLTCQVVLKTLYTFSASVALWFGSLHNCLAEQLDEPIVSDKENRKAEALFKKGHEAFDTKHLSLAEKYYRKAIDLEPNEARFHRQLALLLLKERRLPEAERESRVDIIEDPQDWRGFVVLGKLLHLQRRYDEECEVYKKAIAVLPADQKQLKTDMQNFIDTDIAAAKKESEVKRLRKELEENSIKTCINLKETPLAAAHRLLGARMVDFAGWNMPVQYQSIITEHKAVRSSAGLFDVSHMGEFSISGEDAALFVQRMIANDLEKLKSPNTALYTQFINEDGGTVDDLIVYRRDADYLLVVNASNIDKDFVWLEKHLGDFGSGKDGSSNVQLRNISDSTALLSLQGPLSVAILTAAGVIQAAGLPAFALAKNSIAGIPAEIARTGYTGEDGFEIFVQPEHAEQLWNVLLDVGSKFNIQPCGLGARDTLRLEACLPLYGHELDEQTSPLEAGLGWSVKLNKADFVGKQALEEMQRKGLQKKCVCLRCEGKALPRQGYRVFAGGKDSNPVGTVTSGSQGIHVGYPIAMAYVAPIYTNPGQKLWVEIRDSLVPCEVVPRPFYKRPAIL